ncbi:alpha beta-hydrolase [Rhizopogon vinicolor AM-OR11-026]|uniref:Carboxylic ester hydrolase n=1 Tax=Rhizopogon vinicolor AM-OR11-026 TaxID=1314800 RepID=A0A1B7N0R5_9AGAM|nr:alpha beta-hydrolase [Rhizopogon vinicolor AM-OR11-026]
MLILQSLLALLRAYYDFVDISPLYRHAAPTVTLDTATVTGVASGSVNEWLGIPFALPPTGNLRFQLPQPIPSYNTSFSATAYGPACPQQPPTIPIPPGLPAETIDYVTSAIYNTLVPSSEDCLTVNVVAPANATPGSNLPVVIWIYGGGYETGGTSSYNGSVIINKAIGLNVPAIYVSMNYRLTAFGFLASKEVKEAGVGNLGMQDQRQAMRWVQKYISAFGGDPTKVTIWGESAGAWSVGLHMITNGGNPEGLFRAAFMESGSPIPIGDITHGQGYYDFIVDQTGCAGSSDTLQCLREVPYDTLMNATKNTPNLFSYQSLAIAWLPRVDGVFLTADPQQLVLQGSVADIPFVTGDCDDEGTLFSFSTLNITTDAQLAEYLQTYWFPGAPAATIQQLLLDYPQGPTQGSPYDTGDLNELSAQFKRIASIQGDAAFQAPRRFFLQQRSGLQNTWAFLSKRLKLVPILGSFHTSDLLNVYGGHDMASYLVRFVTNLDPNGSGTLAWPKWTTSAPNLLTFLDGLIPQEITQDTYRADAIAYMINVNLNYTR